MILCYIKLTNQTPQLYLLSIWQSSLSNYNLLPLASDVFCVCHSIKYSPVLEIKNILHLFPIQLQVPEENVLWLSSYTDRWVITGKQNGLQKEKWMLKKGGEENQQYWALLPLNFAWMWFSMLPSIWLVVYFSTCKEVTGRQRGVFQWWFLVAFISLSVW